MLISSRNLTTDAILTTYVLGAIYAWVYFEKKGSILALYLFALAMGLGFLTKGPVIFVVPPVFCSAYSVMNRKTTGRRSGWHAAGAFVLFCVIAGTWFVLLLKENKDFFNYFFVHHMVERYTRDVFHRSEPF